MRFVRLAAAAALALTLAACATPRSVPAPPPSRPVPRPPAEAPAPRPAPAPAPRYLLDVRDLPGWRSEDHVAALRAYQAGCGADPSAAAACSRARALVSADEETARLFFETGFKAQPVGDQFGLLTAYFAPEYPASRRPDAVFTAPVRPRPADLKTGELYAERAEIESRPARDALAWMRPEDLFFLQIQGSGTLVFKDGRRMKATFAAHNGRPFVGIAAPMRELGLLPDSNTSGEAIRAWLAANAGPTADGLMRLNPRYVFFNLVADDGVEPVGAANVPLPAGHAIAVDPAFHQMGAAYWIDAEAPALDGAFPAYRRTVVALDTGGAIKGQVRADLYLGRGQAAGLEAGRVRHRLRMYRLVPVKP